MIEIKIRWKRSRRKSLPPEQDYPDGTILISNEERGLCFIKIKGGEWQPFTVESIFDKHVTAPLSPKGYMLNPFREFIEKCEREMGIYHEQRNDQSGSVDRYREFLSPADNRGNQ